MPPKFGTSGLRGLVTELTGDLINRHIRAFLKTCDAGGLVCVGRDLRPSSPDIMEDVIEAVREAGHDSIDCGALPTPALALAAQRAGAGAVMVTGSHIPADRNGLKFYTRQGEITKQDEEAIRAHLTDQPQTQPLGKSRSDTDAADYFIDRYLTAFAPNALSGRKIGIYAYSAVGRDVLGQILAGLGAEVISLGRSETFIPLDTEAVAPDLRARLQHWVMEHALDALVSTDGDSDRPLLVDEKGDQVPGDILGQITAEYLEADTVVTPVSSNSGVAQKGFKNVVLTRIGSPYVIEGIQASAGKSVGYEANGGFLLGFEAQGPNAPLLPLVTRDCILPIIIPLIAATGGTVSERVAQEPAVVTASDRLQNVPFTPCQRLVSTLADSSHIRRELLATLGEAEADLDLTDGVRMHLAGGGVLHIRTSGNAPELRIYVETTDQSRSYKLLQAAKKHLVRELED